MPDWSTYSPESFLMFSERTYYRLFEMLHRGLWPAQLAAALVGVAILVLLRRADAGSRRVAVMLVATAWLGVAWGFLWTQFATVHIGGRALAALFALQAALLMWTGARAGDLDRARSPVAVQRIGWAMVIFAIAFEPLVGRLLGRPWAHAELFAITPDATVAATIGVLLVAPRSPWYLWPVPFAWSAFSGLTLYALRAPEWWLSPAIALLGIALGIAGRRRPSDF